jgi:hypothetical protein
MIDLSNLLVFLFAASLPVTYVLTLRHFLEGRGTAPEPAPGTAATEHPTLSGVASSHA